MRNAFLIVLLIGFSSCMKEAVIGDKNITIKIGNTTITDNSTFLGLSYDDLNHFSLSEKSIYFSGNDCYYYGGQLYFSNDLKKAEGITGGLCSPYYVDNDGATFSTVNITRNDNAIGGIIEGTFSGKAYRCVSSTDCDDIRYSNFSGSFKLAIRE